MDKSVTIKPKHGGKLHPAQKGEVRNPKGKPKGSRNFKTIIREVLDTNCTVNGEESTYFDAMVVSQIRKAVEGDTSAFKEIRDTLEGRPAQKNIIEDNTVRKANTPLMEKYGVKLNIKEDKE